MLFFRSTREKRSRHELLLRISSEKNHFFLFNTQIINFAHKRTTFRESTTINNQDNISFAAFTIHRPFSFSNYIFQFKISKF